MHPLHRMLVDAAAGRFPPVDGAVEVMPPLAGDHHAVVEFTGHAVLLTDRSSAEASVRGADGFGGATQPEVLRWLAGPDGWVGSHDVVLVAPGRGGGELAPTTACDDHPRVERARAHRRDVRVYVTDDGVVTVGEGLVGRTELSVEIGTGRPTGKGAGRRLIATGLECVASGSLAWAQVAPGNAASLRAFLSCGFTPIGAETLIRRADR